MLKLSYKNVNRICFGFACNSPNKFAILVRIVIYFKRKICYHAINQSAKWVYIVLPLNDMLLRLGNFDHNFPLIKKGQTRCLAFLLFSPKIVALYILEK